MKPLILLAALLLPSLASLQAADAANAKSPII